MMENAPVPPKLLDAAEASIFVQLSSLKRYNIHVLGKKTSVTLEPLVWDLLHEIAQEQECDIHALCDFIYNRKNEDAALASAIRVFVMAYMNVQIKSERT